MIPVIKRQERKTGIKHWKLLLTQMVTDTSHTKGAEQMTLIIPEVLEPMKAKADDKAIEAAFLDPNYIAQRKLDGWRYRLQKDHEGKVSVLSYGTAVVNKVDTGKPVDKTEHVPHLVRWALDNLPNSSLLDGEIITHLNCESHDVTRFLGGYPELAISRQNAEGWLKFAIIDIPFFDGQDLTNVKWYKRQALIERLYVEVFSRDEFILFIPHVSCGPDEAAIRYYEEIVESGGEGVMLKHRESTYIWGGRPKEWQKVKKYKTFDVVVLGFEPPEVEYKGKNPETHPYKQIIDGKETLVTKRHYHGWPGSVIYGQMVEGELKKLGTFSGMNDPTLEDMKVNPGKYVLNVIEVGSMRQNKKSGSLVLPRFKQLRPDKKPEQCILGEC
jgi:ATP-dependent DNA ligase